MFRNLKKITKEISILKKSQNNFFCNYPTFVFEQNLFIILVSQINFLHRLYFHVHYEKAHKQKKFQNFNIKTLTTIASPTSKIVYKYLGVKKIVQNKLLFISAINFN